MVPVGNGLAIIGGRAESINGFDFYNYRDIYFLKCLDRYCDITKMSQELPAPRAFFVAIPIPDDACGCIYKGKFYSI